MVEGGSRPRHNSFRHRSSVTQDCRRRYPENAKPQLPQPSIAPRIALKARTVVSCAVDFDNERSFAAEKVNHIGIYGVLTAELQAAGTSAQDLP
jgi:hypothetical protein